MTTEELAEWLARQQMLMMRSRMLGRDGTNPTLQEPTIRTIARFLAVRRVIESQIARKAPPDLR